ncbi:hypothetical protein FRC02_008244 [Tulasnella sp. 418]|nr:hypothetical protein FRC02_008244 [Tulasnella sp. 418]
MKQLNLFNHTPFNNSGNDAFYTLLCFQYMSDPEGTKIPQPRSAQKDGFPVVASSSNVYSLDRGRDRHSRHFSNGMGGPHHFGGAHDEFGGPTGQRMSIASNGSSSIPFGPFPGMPLPRMSTSGSSKFNPNHASRNSIHSSAMPQNGSSRSLRNVPSPKHTKSVSPVRREGSRATDDSEVFKPPQAPFAREGRQGGRTRSFGAFEDQQNASRNAAMQRTMQGGSSASLQPPNSAPPIPISRPGIRVTHHKEANGGVAPAQRESSGSGRRSPESISGRSGRSFAGSLGIKASNAAVRERSKEKRSGLSEEKRPQSDVLPNAIGKHVKDGEEKSGGGFLATMRRLSLRP